MTLSCGKEKCPQHDHCAYHGDEAGRCPWCHASWDTILDSGHHTCEKPKTWGSQERAQRIEDAMYMRGSAAMDRASLAFHGYEIGGTEPFCPHVEVSPTDDVTAPLPPI